MVCFADMQFSSGAFWRPGGNLFSPVSPQGVIIALSSAAHYFASAATDMVARDFYCFAAATERVDHAENNAVSRSAAESVMFGGVISGLLCYKVGCASSVYLILRGSA
jgi:hypothetical protein